MRLDEGSEFAGYEIRREIGRGAMGVVYVAWDPRLDREVALKVVSEHLADDPAFRERFSREAKAAARVEHPGVVTVYQSGEEGGVPFIAMRLVRGTDLATILARGGRIAPVRATAMLEPIAAGLDAAHAAGIVHRDVKPANILVPDDGSSPVLVDFGIGRVVQGTRATQTGSWVGTVDYVAPEQIRGGEVDGRADQYSLACVFYEMVTGSPPFAREDAIQVMFAHANDEPPVFDSGDPVADSKVNAALARGLAKDPTERYGFCSDLISAAAGVQAARGAGPTGTVIGSAAPSPTGRTGTIIGSAPGAASAGSDAQVITAGNSRSRGRPLIVAGLILLVIAIGAGAFLAFGRGAIESATGPEPPVADCAEAITIARETATLATSIRKGQSEGTVARLGTSASKLLLAIGECRKADPSAQWLADLEAGQKAVSSGISGALVTPRSTQRGPLPRDPEDGNWIVPSGAGGSMYDEINSESKPCYAYANIPAGDWDSWTILSIGYRAVSPEPESLRPPAGWKFLDSWCEAMRGERAPPESVIAVIAGTPSLSAKAARRLNAAGSQIEELLREPGVLTPSP